MEVLSHTLTRSYLTHVRAAAAPARANVVSQPVVSQSTVSQPAVKYRIVHNTTYQYSDSSELCHNLVRLTPRTIHVPSHSAIRNPQFALAPLQTRLASRLTINPAPASLHTYDDYFGNRVHSFAIYQPHLTLSITAESEVAVQPRSELDLGATLPWLDVAEWLRGNRSPAAVEALGLCVRFPLRPHQPVAGRVSPQLTSQPAGRWARPRCH